MFKQSHDLTAKLKAALEEKTTLRDQITMLKRTEADSLREKRSLENELRAAREHASRADEEAEKALAQAERATKETIELRERLAKLDAVDSELKQQREEVSKWKGKTANMKALVWTFLSSGQTFMLIESLNPVGCGANQSCSTKEETRGLNRRGGCSSSCRRQSCRQRNR